MLIFMFLTVTDTDRQTDRQTDKYIVNDSIPNVLNRHRRLIFLPRTQHPTHRQTDILRDRQTDRQTDTVS